MWLLYTLACIGLSSDAMNTDSSGDTASAEIVTEAALSAPSLLDFGSGSVDESLTSELTLSNLGGEALELTELSLDESRFRLETEAPDELLPGESVALSLTFSADYEGSFDEMLSIVWDEIHLTQVRLHAEVLSEVSEDSGDSGDADSDSDSDSESPLGALELTRSSVEFDTVAPGESTEESTSLSNRGDGSLEVLDIVLTDSTFSLVSSPTLPFVLEPGTGEQLIFDFTPTAETTYSAEAELVWWDGDTEQVTPVTLTGVGEVPCTYCSPIIDVDPGGSDPYSVTDFISIFGITDTRRVVITNVGDEDLEVSSAYVINDTVFTSGTFSISGFTAATLGPASTMSFEISYSASSTGLDLNYWSSGIDQNTLHIRSNDPSEYDYVIGLAGTGVSF